MPKFLVFTLLLVLFSGVIIHTAHAQTVETSEQTTLSEDLANNPVAQDILRKIEQTKKWIAELEQRNYDSLEKQTSLILILAITNARYVGKKKMKTRYKISLLR